MTEISWAFLILSIIIGASIGFGSTQSFVVFIGFEIILLFFQNVWLVILIAELTQGSKGIVLVPDWSWGLILAINLMHIIFSTQFDDSIPVLFMFSIIGWAPGYLLSKILFNTKVTVDLNIDVTIDIFDNVYIFHKDVIKK
jgi:hypothetical protein